jgi:hypothetical protein
LDRWFGFAGGRTGRFRRSTGLPLRQEDTRCSLLRHDGNYDQKTRDSIFAHNEKLFEHALAEASAAQGQPWSKDEMSRPAGKMLCEFAEEHYAQPPASPTAEEVAREIVCYIKSVSLVRRLAELQSDERHVAAIIQQAMDGAISRPLGFAEQPKGVHAVRFSTRHT